MRRSDICLYLGPADRAELEALRTDRNTPRKLAWRAGIVLATADGAGNLVERFFAEITTKRIRRGSYASVDDLKGAIYDYLLQHNAKPKPFVWSKSAEDILTRERRALDALDQIRGNR